MERIAIVGSRGYSDLEAVRRYIRGLPKNVTILSGGAPGVDRAAEREARRLGLHVVIYRADWDKLGRGAGIVRNGTIVENCDRVVAFHDGVSRGTQNTIFRAQRAGKPVEVIRAPREIGPEVYLARPKSVGG
jgi:hypothetical protein